MAGDIELLPERILARRVGHDKDGLVGAEKTDRVDLRALALSASFRDDGSGNLGWYVGAAGAVDGAQVKVATVNKANGSLFLNSGFMAVGSALGTPSFNGYGWLNVGQATNGGIIRVGDGTHIGRIIASSVTGVCFGSETDIDTIFLRNGSEVGRFSPGGRMALGSGSNGYHRLHITENTNSLANLLLSTTSLTAQPGITITRLRPTGGVLNGDILGSVQFTGYDGSTGAGKAALTSFVDGTVSTGSCPTGLTILTTPTGTLAPVVRLVIQADGAVKPGVDNTQSLGGASFRWATVYAGAGTINTSDAREKTAVRAFSAAELAAARELAGEIGVYQWLASVDEKGEDGARLHIGMTVQRAIEIMEGHGLDPWRYGFLCRDEITRKVKVVETRSVPATEEVEEAYFEIEVRDGVPVQVAKTRRETRPITQMAPVLDEDGKSVTAKVQATDDQVEIYTEVEMRDGSPVQVSKARTIKVPRFNAVQVVDEAGQPVTQEVLPEGLAFGAKERRPVMAQVPVMIDEPLTHAVPVMVEEEIEVEIEEPAGDRLGFRYDQLTLFIIAGMR